MRGESIPRVSKVRPLPPCAHIVRSGSRLTRRNTHTGDPGVFQHPPTSKRAGVGSVPEGARRSASSIVHHAEEVVGVIGVLLAARAQIHVIHHAH